ncbi:MAG: hypothetical protein IJ887_05760 [Prevotella sp.]|nr:hypothetical protein [Prevotella sp.]
MKKTFILSCLFAFLFTSASADGKLTPNDSVRMTDANYPGLTIIAALRTTGLWTPYMGFTKEQEYDEYIAGRERMLFSLDYKKASESFPLPENPSFVAEMRDLYGNNLFKGKDGASEFTDVLNDIPFVDETQYGSLVYNSIELGGRYAVKIGIENMGNLLHKDTVDFMDIPSLRLLTNSSFVTTGKPLKATAYFNTGYPYDPATIYKGTEQCPYKLDYLGKITLEEAKTAKGETIAEAQHTVKFTDLDKTLIAHRDSVVVSVEKPQLGKYRLIIDSDWDKLGEDNGFNYMFDVEDTLRVTSQLDKETYDLSIDEEALLSLSFDFDYPYITTTVNNVPTFRYYYDLGVHKKGSSIPLVCDSLVLSHDSLATKHFNYQHQFRIPLKNITDSMLIASSVPIEEGSLFPRKMNLTLWSNFNGNKSKNTYLPIIITGPRNPEVVGIDDVTQRSDTDGKFLKNKQLFIRKNGTKYDVSGRRMK